MIHWFHYYTTGFHLYAGLLLVDNFHPVASDKAGFRYISGFSITDALACYKGLP